MEMKSMKKSGFESLLIVPERRDFRDSEEMEGGGGPNGGSDDINVMAEKFRRTTVQKHHKSKRVHGSGSVSRGEDKSSSKSGSRKQDQKSTAAKMEKQLKAPWYIEDLIEEHLNRFRSTATTPPNDVTKQVVPSSAPSFELASVGWFGDWRPSSMLNLLLVMSQSSTSFSDSDGLEWTISELARGTQIEEAVIDEEMAEIQATCILNLPFAFAGHHRDASSSVRSELGKIRNVTAKAQKLRLRTLEEVVKRVLSPTDALQFLVAFERIKEVLHQFASKHEFKKPEVTFSVKALSLKKNEDVSGLL